MKNFISIQVGLLLCVVIFGLMLKGDLTEGPRELHRTFGILANLTALITLVTAYKSRASNTIKTYAALALLLTVTAAVGGISLQGTMNYQLSYLQMAGSGIAALIISCILLVKIDTKSLPKKK